MRANGSSNHANGSASRMPQETEMNFPQQEESVQYVSSCMYALFIIKKFTLQYRHITVLYCITSIVLHN